MVDQEFETRLPETQMNLRLARLDELAQDPTRMYVASRCTLSDVACCSNPLTARKPEDLLEDQLTARKQEECTRLERQIAAMRKEADATQRSIDAKLAAVQARQAAMLQSKRVLAEGNFVQSAS